MNTEEIIDGNKLITLNEAALEYVKEHSDGKEVPWIATDFKAGALSDAAKEYWYAQWQAEQQVPVSEFPLPSEWINEFKEAWYKDNDIGLLKISEIEEMWKETERTCNIIYQYQRRAFEKKSALTYRVGFSEKMERDNNTVYLYYQVEFIDCGFDFDTIVESLEDALYCLKMADIYLDDIEREAKVSITGIGMTPLAYNQWRKEYLSE